jgi:redox-sensitive bicupin YhaK (pirin superfamily)
VLRVMNDDLVQADRGFGTHPHANMEICTYVIEGELTHRDSMGTSETLGRGSIQFMTAGTGVRHSEFNLSKDKPLRFIQMWLQPRAQHLPPNYGSMVGELAQRRNVWGHLVADTQNDTDATPVKINTEANIFVTELDAGKVLNYALQGGRQGYLLCMEGSARMSLDGQAQEVKRHDAARLRSPRAQAATLSVTAGDEGAHLLLVEMAATAA